MTSKQQVQATTIVTSDQCTFTWTIKNYRLLKVEVEDAIESPKFEVGSEFKSIFQLRLYPEGKSAEYAGCIGLFLKPVEDPTNETNLPMCKCTMSAINGTEVIQTMTFHYNFATPEGFSSYGWPKFVPPEKINSVISPNNTLTILCDLEIFKDFENILVSKTINGSADEINDRVNLKSLFLSEEFSDVKLRTSDGNDIPAHKNILALASPVFRAMFTHDMLEKKRNLVEIKDIPHKILVEMLRYIYTGNIVSTKTDTVVEILKVSDKYQIENLKIKCSKILCANFSIEYSIKLLLISHKYKAKYLENEIIKFVSDNIQLLIDSGELKEIKDPEIWMKILKCSNQLVAQ